MVKVLRDYQREAIDDLRSRWDAGATRVPLVLATGLGKGHPLDTDVPTPDGWRRWGDLQRGDLVFGRNGVPTTVTAVFDRGELPAYRVTMSDGSAVDVDGDHLWTVRDSGVSYRPWIDMSTAELARHEMKRQRGWRFHIPMASPVAYAPMTLPLGAYTVGALIANGGMTHVGTALTTPDPWVAERVRADGLIVNKARDEDPSICDRYHVTGVTQVTRELGIRVHSKLKRIPPAYLMASVEDRIALLNGLMDGDGAKRDRSRRSVAYFTSSRGLADDVSELVTSLGGTGIVKTYDRGAKGVEYAVRILLPTGVPAFSDGRKSDNGVESVRNLQPKRAIVSIEPIGVREIRCISVASADSLYLIGRQHIVTHNSVIQSHLADEWLNANPGRRVLVIAHTIELIEQMAAHMRKTGRRVGVVMGARNAPTAEIVVASRQTLGNAKRLGQLRNVGMIMIDECHFAVRANTYGRILEHFGAFDDPPRVQVAGFTATLSRSDKQKLSTIWEGCTFSRDISFGIRNGFLMDVRGARIVVDELDMRNVATKGGDWDAASLGEELERSFAVETIAKRYLELSEGRRGLAFWPLVSVAQHAAEVFNDLGIPSGVVWGAQDKRERAAVLAAHKAGDILCVHNAMALTVGYDDPGVDVILMGRNTKSRGLYTQMAGRGLRPPIDPETGKPVDTRTLGRQALIIDVTGASEDNDLSLFIDLSPDLELQGAYDEHPDATLGELEEILAAEIEEEIEAQRAGASYEFESEEYAGPTTTKAFDPLDREKAWGLTAGGNYYVRASRVAKGDSFVFLLPSLAGPEGTWDVAGCSRNTGFNPLTDAAPEWATGTAWNALPLEQAMLHSEGIAGDAYNTRRNSWYNRPPGKHLRIAAYRRGIAVGQMTHGELQEAVDASIANERIDTLVASVRSRVQESSV